MSVLGLQRGIRRELHISPASGASRLWLEDRQAPGHGQKKKRESYKRCHGRTRQGVARIRGVQAGKQRKCLILHPRSAAGANPALLGRPWNAEPPPAPSPVPNAGSPEVSKPLAQGLLVPSLDQHTPELSFSVLCKALPTPHLPRAQRPAETQLQRPRGPPCVPREKPRAAGG